MSIVVRRCRPRLLLAVLTALPLVWLAARPAGSAAAVMGAAAARPYGEAVATSRAAARAVLARQGRESCLIGKLTNALLGLSSSCEAAGERGPLCALADHAAATTRWSMAFTDATARSVLNLSGDGGGGGAGVAAGVADPASAGAAEAERIAP